MYYFPDSLVRMGEAEEQINLKLNKKILHVWNNKKILHVWNKLLSTRFTTTNLI